MRERPRTSISRGGTRNRRPGTGLVPGLGLAVLLACGSACAAKPSVARMPHAATADLGNQPASVEVRRVERWVLDSRDNHGMPYLIVDKSHAEVFVFDRHAHLQGVAPALLGLAKGDGSVAGIGDRTMSSIQPGDRTTPAGRFKASLDHDVHGQEILVIDYAASISLHAVVKGTPAERRAQRLQSATSDDNRISYGCINVPAAFYKNIVSRSFAHTFGIVYILPEMSPADAFFGFHDVDPDLESPPHDSPRAGIGAPPVASASVNGIPLHPSPHAFEQKRVDAKPAR